VTITGTCVQAASVQSGKQEDWAHIAQLRMMSTLSVCRQLA